MTNTNTHLTTTHCRNCGVTLRDADRFCWSCGQDTAPHPPTAWEFLHEFITHYVALEGKLVRTLGMLLFKPGQLSKEYIAGRKNRYVLPLRIYLTASIVFFMAVKVIGLGDGIKVVAADPDKPAVNVHVDTNAEPGGDKDEKTLTSADLKKPAKQYIHCGDGEGMCGTIKEYLEKKYKDQTVEQMLKSIREKMFSAAPYAIFLMLPFFALVTRLIYWNRKLYYGEHLVYAFHVHAFTFIGLLLMALVPGSLDNWVMLAMMIYYFIAQHRFFGGRWWATSLRYFTIANAYPMLMGLAITGVLLFAVFV